MTLTGKTEVESLTTALVRVRIPRGAGADLATDAERRLSYADGVADVTVDGLRGIEPNLSATVVTVDVTLRVAETVTAAELRDRLADAPGVEAVERVG